MPERKGVYKVGYTKSMKYYGGCNNGYYFYEHYLYNGYYYPNYYFIGCFEEIFIIDKSKYVYSKKREPLMYIPVKHILNKYCNDNENVMYYN